MKTKLIKYLTLTSLLLTAPSTWAETTNCTPITTLPTVITTQGIYCLTGNLVTSMASGNAIEIQTNNVVIDLNGWKLGGLAAGTGTFTTGIYANQRKTITIRNGTIRGFYRGIWLDDTSPYTTSQGHLIEDIRADKNTYMGIMIIGRGNIVRRNQVVDTGGSTAYSNMPAVGIVLNGPGGRILDNDISQTAGTGTGSGFGLNIGAADGVVTENNSIDGVSSDASSAYGVHVSSSNGFVAEDNRIIGIGSAATSYGLFFDSVNDAVVEDNRIIDLSSSASTSYGLYLETSANVLAVGNRITSAGFGIEYSALWGGSSGKYMDNLTSNVTTPFTGGIDAGGNN